MSPFRLMEEPGLGMKIPVKGRGAWVEGRILDWKPRTALGLF